ncbi:MAG: Crp/Fnr family transcriptional regulator [Clostridiaceae bacterium]|nr:Crp/Fnr family transcriptional regulator [Clostridiaceae bacterium]
MKKICEVLGQTKLFDSMDHSVFQPYCSRTSIRLIWKGEIVVNEGDRCEGISSVVSGTLAVQKYSADGEYVTLNLLEPGDSFGEEFFFGSNKEYTYSIEAVSNAQVIHVPRDVMMNMLENDEEVRDNFMRDLSDKVNAQYSRINILSQRNLRLKISRYLLELHYQTDEEEERRYGYMQKKTPVSTASVELPVSKEVAAKLLAMPRPSFSRELVRMEKEGLIRVSGRVIWLTNLEALEADGQIDELEDEE